MTGVSAVPGQSNATAPDADDAITVIPAIVAPMRTATRQIDWAVQTTTKKTSSPDGNAKQTAKVEKTSKKKSSSFFNFLTVKEPTSGALEQYAQSQKKQAAEKGTAFMAGISSQKLPAEVPRVNTKWDGLPQPKRPSTGSTTTLYGRRDSNTTASSSSRMSRKSHKSAASSSMEFDFGPPPSLESLSTKSNPRHDSGTGCQVFDPIRPPSMRDRRPSAGDTMLQMAGALPQGEKSGSSEETVGAPATTTKARDLRSKRSKTGLRKNSSNLPPKAIQEIAPWAEPSEPSSSYHLRTASGGMDDMEFITSPETAEDSAGELDGDIDEQLVESERRIASLTVESRMPPSSNPQALAQLEPAWSRQKKGRSKFMRLSGKK